MATAIFLMLSGNSMDFTSHTVEGVSYYDCLDKVLVELGSPCLWDVYDHEVVKGEFGESDTRLFAPHTVPQFTEDFVFDDDIPF